MRHRISLKTKLASALLALGHIPYDDVKLMTEDQIISLYQFDHNMLHSSEHEDRDEFWNLTPKLIREHREKTKQDAKVIAKSKRIRQQAYLQTMAFGETIKHLPVEEQRRQILGNLAKQAEALGFKRKIQSRGFDKTRRKKMDGTVVKR